ncbi:MAG: 8-amino-7-oxononanoate synthase [Candidatus Omnitrophota bacterium]|nr:8-amino-7-oxononanoate synthase [Candidatus Omnitrophota bacterium]
MAGLDLQIAEFLKEKEDAGELRILKPISGRHNGRICFKEQEYIDFSSNDYLGLSSHPKLIEESKKAIDKFGTASSASRLLSGSLNLHHLLEERLACFKDKESALVFNSGYHANIGVISSIYADKDVVFSDRLNHASIIDGIRLSQAHFFRFQHNDLEHLDSLLKKERSKFRHALIVTESLFSMDGDRPPLKELVYLKEKYDCQLMVDEAHATGIFGRNGSGVVEEEGLVNRVDLLMGTFSKALGGYGGYLAASKRITGYLVNTARSFIYSTALPPSAIAANLAAIEIIKNEPWRRKDLLENVRYFRQALSEKGLSPKGEAQIVPLITKDSLRTVELSEKLQAKGYWVLPIRPPTVPRNQARLRFSLTTHHHQKILRKLIDDLTEIGI